MEGVTGLMGSLLYQRYIDPELESQYTILYIVVQEEESSSGLHQEICCIYQSCGSHRAAQHS